MCFQLQRREPLVCKLQLLHLYISWQPPLTFDQIYPHCPPKRFQKCHHGSHCNTPKHMQKCKDIFSFCIQKQIVSLIKSILSEIELYIATDRPRVSCICENETRKAKHCRETKKKRRESLQGTRELTIKNPRNAKAVHLCSAVHQTTTSLNHKT